MNSLLLSFALPLFLFDNGAGRGVLSIDEQAEVALRNGYAGLFYSGTKEIPALLEAHQKRGLKVLGIYTGINLADATPAIDPGLPRAIEQLKGSGALITFTIQGPRPDGDDAALPILRGVCEQAARAGLKVALYPHHGFHVARVEDALRLIAKARQPNLGLVFNLAHWLRSGDEPNFTARLAEALPHTMLVSINGADHEGDWDRLIQPLGQGAFDTRAFVQAFLDRGYRGPFGLQCYNIKGDREANAAASMRAWRGFAPAR